MPASVHRLRTVALTVIAMTAFAANSLFARAALGGASIDPVLYTAIRLVAGAVLLAGLLRVTRGVDAWRVPNRDLVSAFALAGYAVTFSLAYLRLGAATGALILFASVQGTMVAWGLLRGNRPTSLEIAGLVIAFAGMVVLLLPGIGSPDLFGTALMVASGFAWGVYSLRGRASGTDPVVTTTVNFVWAALPCLPLLLVPALWSGGTAFGVALAVASGAIASGLGYVIWYAALPGLSPTQAAVVQSSVPALAAIGGVLLLGELLTGRLIVAGAVVLAGVTLAMSVRSRSR